MQSPKETTIYNDSILVRNYKNEYAKYKLATIFSMKTNQFTSICTIYGQRLLQKAKLHIRKI